ncbi:MULTISPECIES: hypothetical protein [Streptomyces]|uniref:hypothetical protein n=1 Tax=Streptomyces TaxID=1883 RepID=UPI001F35F537|nr:hypothetical protein [Streptomyces noursei]MCE4945589.1 hypothetical protein [Streptomyces noursei]
MHLDAVQRRAGACGGERGQGWLDLLPDGIETVIGTDSTLDETVDRILYDTGLAGLHPREEERRDH